MEKQTYKEKAVEFDTRFKILVTKGGLSLSVYESHKHNYCLGYYPTL